MTKSLKGKLILSFLMVAIITVVVASALIGLTSNKSLMNLVAEQQTAQLEETVQAYFTANGTLEGFFDYYVQINHKAPGESQGEYPDKPFQMKDIRGVQGLVDTQYRALIPTYKYEVGQTLPAEMFKQAVAVEVDGETIAWILPDTSMQFNLNPEEELFLQRTSLAISLAAIAGVIAAVALGFVLANGLLKPIKKLTQASKALAHGELDQKVPVTSEDELGQLTLTFNQMSADLVRADEQRKRLTADITHDLSTPLQVISGYMEMIDEGEVALSPQRIDIIKTEIEHLRRLVGDLTVLTQVEAKALDIQLQPVSPSKIMEHIHHTFQPIAARQSIELMLDLPDEIPSIYVDEGRILQVLKNLIENALRYTPKGGKIILGVRVSDMVELTVRDNGAGIDADDLPYVFDRFYQADKARSANSGKMGLGLAICKALIAAQGGTITAESAGKGQGTTMRISFNKFSDEKETAEKPLKNLRQ